MGRRKNDLHPMTGRMKNDLDLMTRRQINIHKEEVGVQKIQNFALEGQFSLFAKLIFNFNFNFEDEIDLVPFSPATHPPRPKK